MHGFTCMTLKSCGCYRMTICLEIVEKVGNSKTVGKQPGINEKLWNGPKLGGNHWVVWQFHC